MFWTKVRPFAFQFDVVLEQVIDGLDKAIMKMKKGEIAEIEIAGKYAFGEETKFEKATVPAGADVIYEVRLVDFKNPTKHYDLSAEEKLELARANKEKGNKAYKEGKYVRAVNKYEAAIKPIEFDKDMDEAMKKETKEMKRVLWLNIAAVCLKQNEWNKVISNCDKVLQSDPNNIKALFRRSQAYMSRSDFIEAEADIRLAYNLDPSNRDVRAQYKKLKQQMKSSSEKEAEMYSTMFKRLAESREREETEATETMEEEDPTMIAGPSGE